MKNKNIITTFLRLLVNHFVNTENHRSQEMCFRGKVRKKSKLQILRNILLKEYKVKITEFYRPLIHSYWYTYPAFGTSGAGGSSPKTVLSGRATTGGASDRGVTATTGLDGWVPFTVRGGQTTLTCSTIYKTHRYSSYCQHSHSTNISVNTNASCINRDRNTLLIINS